MSCSKESSNMAVEKNPRVTMNFYQKTMSSSYHIKNIMRIFIEATCTNTYALEKKLLGAATSENLQAFQTM